MQSLRYAFRQLRRAPSVTAAVVLTLALGIGANSVMLTLLDTLLLSPPAGVHDAGELRRIYLTGARAGSGAISTLSVPDYEAFRADVPGLGTVAAYTGSELTVGRGRAAHPVRASLVTGEYFALLGGRVATGRLLGPGDDRESGPRVAVISHGYWERRFAGDSGIVGRLLQVGDGSYEIVGVAAEGFTGTDLRAVDIWLPIRVAGPGLIPGAMTRDVSWVQVIGRLTPATSAAAAAAQATVAWRRAVAAEGEREVGPRGTIVLGPIQEGTGPEGSPASRVVVWTAAIAGLMLLVACANVANLLLARALARRHELAVRIALGAARGTIARHLLAESLLLGILGAAAALLVALWGGPVVRSVVLPPGSALNPPFDWRVVLPALALGVLAGILAGLLPATQGSAAALTDALRSGGRQPGGLSRARTLLVTAQVMLTTVLLVGAALFVRSLDAVQRLDLGLDLDRVLLVDVDLEEAGIPAARLSAIRQELLARAAAVPGVSHAALSRGGPFGHGFGTGVRVPGLDSTVRPSRRLGPFYFAVSGGYFGVMGTPLRAGRTIHPTDAAGTAPVVVVNETMARLLWPGRRAVGECLVIDVDPGGRCREVVGVVADTRRQQLLEDPLMMFYVPLAQLDEPGAHQTLYVRAADGVAPAALRGPLRESLVGVAPDLPYVSVEPLTEVVAPQLVTWRLGAAMFTAFAALALLVAAVGLYGMLAYLVAQRTREIGLRMALGANAGEVTGLVLRQGLLPVLAGALAGGVLALIGARSGADMLYGVGPTDPVAYASATAALLLILLAACVPPARRATRVSPTVALRAD
ncbi:MAG TPA: ADOP family duplicated permease [Gemmatimonadales bacterium]|nr:ADOP family duplicated permease [Gemmatimonadales bacterium]